MDVKTDSESERASIDKLNMHVYHQQQLQQLSYHSTAAGPALGVFKMFGPTASQKLIRSPHAEN